MGQMEENNWNRTTGIEQLEDALKDKEKSYAGRNN